MYVPIKRNILIVYVFNFLVYDFDYLVSLEKGDWRGFSIWNDCVISIIIFLLYAVQVGLKYFC